MPLGKMAQVALRTSTSIGQLATRASVHQTRNFGLFNNSPAKVNLNAFSSDRASLNKDIITEQDMKFRQNHALLLGLSGTLVGSLWLLSLYDLPDDGDKLLETTFCPR